MRYLERRERGLIIIGLHICFVIACIECTSGSLVQAAPITFTFEATINSVYVGIPFNLGIDYQVGDVVAGKFAFDPLEGDGSTAVRVLQPHDFLLNVNGAVFATPSFEIESVNDALLIAEYSPASVVDILAAGGAGLSAANPADFPNLSLTQSSFLMRLDGPESALPIASVPANASDWNSFNLSRQMIVSFRDGNGGAIGFQATVGDFVVLPEPSSLLGSLLGILILLTHHRQIVFRSNRQWR